MAVQLLSEISFFAIFEWILRVIALLTVPRRRSDASARAWLLFIFFFPTLGWLVYAIFGSVRFPEWRLIRRQAYREGLEPSIRALRSHLSLTLVTGHFESVPQVAERLGRQAPLGGNRMILLSNYDEAVESLVRDINQAKNHVHLLFYIFADDKVGRKVAESLAAAVKRGVECRVLVDALGSKKARRRLVPWMRAQGIEVQAALKLGDLRRMARIDLRNHRKIAVIDGSVAHTGSLNLVSADFKPGMSFEELVVRVEGPAVLGLQAVFACDWYAETECLLSAERYYPQPISPGNSIAQVLPGDPGFPRPTLHRVLLLLLGLAKRKVILTTPYFVPDEPILEAMELAVLRGVEVHLIVSQKMDQWFVGFAQRSFYEQLLNVGVQIHQYREDFLHAKHFSVDDSLCGIGSSNIDIRSFKINAEVTLLIYDPTLATELRGIEESYFNQSDLITSGEWAKRGRLSRWSESIARLVSPLL